MGSTSQRPADGLLSAARSVLAQARRGTRYRRTVLGVALAAFALLWAFGVARSDLASPETAVTESVCRLLLANTTEGRQGLVSSVWWPPIPVLLRLPAAVPFARSSAPVASMAVSALFGVATCLLFERFLRRRSFGVWRAGVLAGLIASPGFLRECVSGSSATTVVFLACAVTFGLIEWIRARSTPHLTIFAFASAILIATNLEMAPWVLLGFALLIGHELGGRAPREQKAATVLLAVAPAFYAAGLWLLMNWLVMGDALYCLRSLTRGAHGAEMAGAAAADLLGPAQTAVAAAAAGVLVAAAVARNRPGVYAGLLAVAPLVLTQPMLVDWRPWDPSFLLQCGVPLGLLAAAHVASDGARAARARRITLACAAVILAALLGNLPAAAPHSFAYPDGMAAVSMERDLLRWRIEKHVLKKSRYAKVFVCGYDAFRLIGADDGLVFAHALDLDFREMQTAYRGHTLFVLVRRPSGRGAMDSIHWKYESVFKLGYGTTLLDGDWGAWRLFEIEEAPRPPRR